MSDAATMDGLPGGTKGVVTDFSADKQSFHVPWGKAMMWIFLLSDTFIFSCFLVGYMHVRMAATDPWPFPSEVFALSFGGDPIPAYPDCHHDVHPDYLVAARWRSRSTWAIARTRRRLSG